MSEWARKYVGELVSDALCQWTTDVRVKKRMTERARERERESYVVERIWDWVSERLIEQVTDLKNQW
jgi:hypothetical protein